MEKLINDNAIKLAMKDRFGMFCSVTVRNETYRLFDRETIKAIITKVRPIRNYSSEYDCKYQTGLTIELIQEIEPNSAVAYVVGYNKDLGMKHAFPVFFDVEKAPVCLSYKNVLSVSRDPGGKMKDMVVVDEQNSLLSKYAKIKEVRF